jgi:uncharacterized protein (TIGR02646 family)
MLQVTKSEPSFFTQKKRTISKVNESIAWNEIEDIRSQLREYILKHEQENMCAYCEKKIDSSKEKSHIEHFKARNHFPELTLEYSNLFVSCNHHFHCGKKKDSSNLQKNDFNILISPLENNDEHFEYTFDGTIEGKTPNGRFTQKILNLNEASLQEERKSIIRNIKSYLDFELETLCECLSGHKNLIQYLINNKELLQ